MGDEVEKICPLCTEEMDLTDQQLKPCKCGYDICVWCWHHIMGMAEKDDTEGRCPACRTPYDKEKIVATTVKCERLVSEINSERRLKPQKVKAKASEGRKHLNSIRVIQRNLVYISGIPSSLADEDVLQRKEYFGQYGKVLKVSISRNSGGAIQYSANNTFSVYITYSKEDEAARCIQSVHGYVLEDRSLRACFGTTKYCHAWLRNTPCNNPDCLYLHEVGSQEDSFSKDEIVSAYTRSRAQQIAGATNNMLRRSGNVLPPPADEYNSSTPSEKPIARSVPNNSSSHVKGSPPSGASERSIALPAAASWGLRVSNGLPLTTTSDCSTGPIKQNPDGCNGSSMFPSAVGRTTMASKLLTDVGKKSIGTEENHVVQPNGKFGFLEPCKQSMARDNKTSDKPEEVVQDAFSATTCPPVSENKDVSVKMLLNVSNSKVPDRQSSNSASDEVGIVATDEITQRLCAGLSSIAIGSHTGTEISNANGSVSNHLSSSLPGNEGLEQLYYEHATKPFVREPVASLASRETARASDGVFVSRELSDWGSVSLVRCGEAQEDLQDLDGPSLKFSEVVGHPMHLSNSPNLIKGFSHSNGHTRKDDDSCTASNHASGDRIAVPTKVVETSLPFRSSELLLSNGYFENKGRSAELERTSDRSSLASNVEAGRYLGSFNADAANVLKNSTVDMGESSIISNILSMDFDPWDVSLASPHNFAKLFSETEHGSLKIPSSRKVQSSNQSMFAFARQEDLAQGPYLEPYSSNTGHMNKYPIHQDSVRNGDLYLEKRQPGFSSYILEESDTFPSRHSIISPSKLSVSRGPISAPPGFSIPSRATPPGFSSQERVDQTFNTSVNHLLENSLLRNHYRTQPTRSFGSIEDVEFNDPAILAVGKGMLPNGMNNFTPQIRASENDPRLQLLMQQSFSAHQNLRFPDQIGDRFSPPSDAYSIPLRNPEQFPFAQSSVQSRNVHIPNGHWEGWNEIQSGNDLVIAELLRNERLGFDKYFPGHEDLKYRIPSSGDPYNRAFGIYDF